MTPTEIDALKAGPDLDRLVAEACGIAVHTDRLIRPGSTPLGQFRPSTSWDDAIRAAEAFAGEEPFSVARLIDYTKDNPECFWETRLRYQFNAEYRASGPVAICRAILKASKP